MSPSCLYQNRTATAADESKSTADAMNLEEPEVPRDGDGDGVTTGAETLSLADASLGVEGVAAPVSDDGEVSGDSTAGVKEERDVSEKMFEAHEWLDFKPGVNQKKEMYDQIMTVSTLLDDRAEGRRETWVQGSGHTGRRSWCYRHCKTTALAKIEETVVSMLCSRGN
ncbi:hypothetical protein SAY86_012522 [Trapa natans]|uniref:Uncharacterized protein n=1 Tax=Trapa natans TaxID=22666 RepID=A0AAN7MCU3_TRANT|nr:hypothetical protein SAY86_012522 [Trapa natans]